MAGFTLFNLMLTLAILSILAMISMPNLKQMVAASRLASAANGFAGTLNMARSEAAKRGVRVTLCKSADGATCTLAGNWSQGWILFQDDDNSCIRTGGEPLIQASAAQAKFTITGSGTGANYISYIPTGMTKTASNAFLATTFKICDNAYGGATGRQVVVSASGRARIATGSCP